MRTLFKIITLLMFCLTSMLGASGCVELCMHNLVDWHITDTDENDCHSHHEHSDDTEPCHEHAADTECGDEYAFTVADGHECTHLEIEGVVDPLIASQQSVEAPELQIWESVSNFIFPETTFESIHLRLQLTPLCFLVLAKFSERSSVFRL